MASGHWDHHFKKNRIFACGIEWYYVVDQVGFLWPWSAIACLSIKQNYWVAFSYPDVVPRQLANKKWESKNEAA